MKTIGQIIHQNKSYLIILDNAYNELYFESLFGYWEIRKYDKDSNEIYFENSEGDIYIR